MELAAHTADIQKTVRPQVVQVVREWIRYCMASGKAA
jgi:hypothetical protein